MVATIFMFFSGFISFAGLAQECRPAPFVLVRRPSETAFFFFRLFPPQWSSASLCPASLSTVQFSVNQSIHPGPGSTVSRLFIFFFCRHCQPPPHGNIKSFFGTPGTICKPPESNGLFFPIPPSYSSL